MSDTNDNHQRKRVAARPEHGVRSASPANGVGSPSPGGGERPQREPFTLAPDPSVFFPSEGQTGAYSRIIA
ncbi:MAG: hypothetical protein ACR2RL_16180, partial [Gammaproteobacteria bacterium]